LREHALPDFAGQADFVDILREHAHFLDFPIFPGKQILSIFCVNTLI